MRGSKVLSIVLSLALALTLLPFGAFHASAANASVSLVGSQKVYTDEKTTSESITVYFKLDPANVAKSSAFLSLVDDNGKKFKFTAAKDPNYTANPPVSLNVYESSGGERTTWVLQVEPDTGKKNEFQLVITPEAGQDGVGTLYLRIDPASRNDEFSYTELKVAQFSSRDPQITVIDKDRSISDEGGTVRFQLSEEVPYVFDSNKTITLTLPDGFAWGSADVAAIVSGEIAKTDIDIKTNNKDLNIKVTPKYTASNPQRIIFEVEAGVNVVKSSTARKGEIRVAVSNAEPRTIIIGKYGDYEVTVTSEPGEIWAGRKVETGEIAGKIVLEEYLAGSLVEGRTIKLTLPVGAEWPENPNDAFDYDKGSNKAKLRWAGYERLDGKNRVAKFAVDRKSTSSGKTVIEVKQVFTEAKFPEGPLTVEVTGSGVPSTKVTLANVKHIVSVASENKTGAVIGAQDQPLGNIVIKETVAGALRGGKSIIINAGDFITQFTAVDPVVEVRSGDIELGNARLEDASYWNLDKYYELGTSNRNIVIEVRRASNEPSEIVIKGVRATIDRTAPEGEIPVKVAGSAVVDSDEPSKVLRDNGSDDFDYKYIEVSPVRVVTPADKSKDYRAKFTIDQTSYSVNGETKTMDVAPYIKDNRTFVPVKYVAEALGVKDTDIIWNPYAKSVTIFKGDRVIQMKIGSKTLLVNGSAIEMDTAPEIKNARTMLPIAWVAKALNVEYKWVDDERSVEFYNTAQ
ncbi:copper amine oxidase N-terminal domain-containing protein [Hydrogenibacillus sp. N12]|uniref:copper amine oxidase N-terminal domain-containing protein n=1 Tax=Hydrogenibacillus sp. N12 TaxID=2866627 RepID=UPI001C7DC71B|nr:copper amine oxidase N-terminal domain-containing protein [Hydrogenibacillus sp. N12]QZA32867.1 copper amine oxidase N-terminal domain-containing protein [Hydrogenibacillus sp. N12]